jgi:hypothetical protein
MPTAALIVPLLLMPPAKFETPATTMPAMAALMVPR